MQSVPQYGVDGREFEGNCEKLGLCLLCGQTKVKKRGVFKLKKNHWHPVTERSKDGKSYIVYKGYCVKPGCFTLTQAKKLLGEIGPSHNSVSGQHHDGDLNAYEVQQEPDDYWESNGEADNKGDRKGLSHFWKGKGHTAGASQSGKSAVESNPSKKVFDNVFAGFSGSSRDASGTVGRGGVREKKAGSIGRDEGRSMPSVIRRDDDDVSVGSAMTSESKVRTSLKQLLQENMGAILDLSSTRLHHVHISELAQSLEVASKLQTLILENCRLNDNEIEILAKGLASDKNVATSLARISFRSNRIGNRGAVSLRPFLFATSSLEELDLSKNQIGSRGANYVFHALRDNPQVKIRMINLAHNEIWDVDGDGSFFATNHTLKLLNLEGNFVHDEGIESVTLGLRTNCSKTKLQELYLGWNGIGDEGCIHIAHMLENNRSLRKLGLGENDITSVGAKALLSAIGFNETLTEVSGLSHNQIDRMFILSSIKLLLYSNTEKLPAGDEAKDLLEEIMEWSMNGNDTLVDPVGTNLPTAEETSESSLDWADKLFAPGEDAKPPIAEITAPGVPLGEITASPLEGLDARNPDAQRKLDDDSDARAILQTSLPHPQYQMDRVTVFQAAPLVYTDTSSSMQHLIPLRDYDHERDIIKHAVEGATKLNTAIDVDTVVGTAETLRTFFESGSSRVLHFSCFGHPKQTLALESDDGQLDDIIDFETLKEVLKSAKSQISLVVVNSFYSGRIGKAFLDAGVPHVICCHHTEIFRDEASYSFLKNLYRALALNRSIKEAFHDAQEAVRVEEITKHLERYVLLPKTPQIDSFHDVPAFYTAPVPPAGMIPELDQHELDEELALLPQIPRHFIGRELDMHAILEALKIDTIVRIGGVKGIGKTSVVAACTRYIKQRKKYYQFDNVFWLPPAKGIVPSPDTLFGDLSFFLGHMSKSKESTPSDDFAMEVKERIMLELDGQRTLLTIDSRKFVDNYALSTLELFLGEILDSQLDVKVILIGQDASNGDDEDENEDTITLGPIDLKSAALLFGEISRFITSNGCPAAQSPDEFAALMVPPSVVFSRHKTEIPSTRQARLMTQIGNGVPREVLRAGKNMPASVFIHLIGMANTPEVQINSHSSLDVALKKWSHYLENAVVNKNYLRAMDLEHVMRELHSFKKHFPSLDELMTQEQELHRRHTACFKNRQYEEGNRLKREIIALKKRILHENRSATSPSKNAAKSSQMSDLQEQVNSIMRLANSSFSSETELPSPERTDATFILGSSYHNCELHIHPGNVCDFDPQNNDLGAVVCWTNECCDLKLNTDGQTVLEYGGTGLARDIASLPGITKTPWGVAKCGTGNAVIVGPGTYGSLKACCVVLAVGPISTSCTDNIAAEDRNELHYIKVMMRSCIRSSMILAKHSQVQSIAFPTLIPDVDCTSYEPILVMQLKLLVDEARYSDLISLHIVARSEAESSKLIGIALELGLQVVK